MTLLQLVYTGILSLFLQPDPKVSNPAYADYLQELYSTKVPHISVSSLEQSEDQNMYILDCRESKEYKISHIKYARQVGNIWFDMRDVYDIPEDALVVVYCTVGDRSERVAEKLINAGYKQVYLLYGGLIEWVNEGNPVYTEKEIQTPQVYLGRQEWQQWLVKGKAIFK